MKNLIYILLAALLFVACEKNEHPDIVEGRVVWKYQRAEQMIVASETRMVYYLMGNYGPSLVIKAPESSWEFLYGAIDGFDWETGYECVLNVKIYRPAKIEDLPMDASSVKYVLDKVISKTSKQSEGLPEGVVPQ